MPCARHTRDWCPDKLSSCHQPRFYNNPKCTACSNRWASASQLVYHACQLLVTTRLYATGNPRCEEPLPDRARVQPLDDAAQPIRAACPLDQNENRYVCGMETRPHAAFRCRLSEKVSHIMALSRKVDEQSRHRDANEQSRHRDTNEQSRRGVQAM